jgi:hypothetical protein
MSYFVKEKNLSHQTSRERVLDWAWHREQLGSRPPSPEQHTPFTQSSPCVAADCRCGVRRPPQRCRSEALDYFFQLRADPRMIHTDLVLLLSSKHQREAAGQPEFLI